MSNDAFRETLTLLADLLLCDLGLAELIVSDVLASDPPLRDMIAVRKEVINRCCAILRERRRLQPS